MNSQYEPLFTPMKIGTLEIKNRFVLEPMEGTNIIGTMNGVKYEENVHDYYIERAKAGIGLMIPGMMLLRSLGMDKWTYKCRKEFLRAKPLIEEIHQYGTKIFFQLGAGWGRSFVFQQNMKKLNGNKVLRTLAKPVINLDHLLVAPSPVPNRWMPEVMHRVLTKAEIHEMVDAYAKTAKLCQEIGVDGVEIHAVHEGYLLDQFTTKYTNSRTDEYGGSFENRYRFAVDIVNAIKEACGTDYPVSMRYSVTSKTKGFGHGAVPGEDYVELGRDLTEGLRAAKYLQDAGYDMLNADNGTYDAWFWSHPPVYMPLNCNLSEVEQLKKVVDIPVVCAGRMQPETGAAAIAAGKIDGLGIARQFLTDPEFILKIKENRPEDVLPCIACHNACLPIYHYVGIGAELTEEGLKTQGHCALNPRTFCEKKYTITPATDKKEIAVIGGGIGGLTFAIIATKRGHHVTVYEKTGELGGVFIAAAAPSFKEKDRDLIKWYVRQVEQLKIELRLHTEITDIASVHADEIVIATGATARKLKVEGAERCVEAIEYLRGYQEVKDHVAVIGGGLTGCEIAYDLAQKGKHPVIVEMMDDILMTKGLCMANSSCLRELLAYHKVPVYTKAALKAIGENSIIIESDGAEQELTVDSVITSCGYIAGTSLLKDNTAERDPHIHLLGDVGKVANLQKAIWDAYDLAFAL